MRNFQYKHITLVTVVTFVVCVDFRSTGHLALCFYFLFVFFLGSEDCSRNFTNTNGTIESPGYPDKYPHNLDCVFTILAKPKMEIILQFLNFDLEYDPLQVGEGDCKYDWLDIWDGIPNGMKCIGFFLQGD